MKGFKLRQQKPSSVLSSNIYKDNGGVKVIELKGHMFSAFCVQLLVVLAPLDASKLEVKLSNYDMLNMIDFHDGEN